jgi:hypothetical protein
MGEEERKKLGGRKGPDALCITQGRQPRRCPLRTTRCQGGWRPSYREIWGWSKGDKTNGAL